MVPPIDVVEANVIGPSMLLRGKISQKSERKDLEPIPRFPFYEDLISTGGINIFGMWRKKYLPAFWVINEGSQSPNIKWRKSRGATDQGTV